MCIFNLKQSKDERLFQHILSFLLFLILTSFLNFVHELIIWIDTEYVCVHVGKCLCFEITSYFLCSVAEIGLVNLRFPVHVLHARSMQTIKHPSSQTSRDMVVERARFKTYTSVPSYKL